MRSEAVSHDIWFEMVAWPVEAEECILRSGRAALSSSPATFALGWVSARVRVQSAKQPVREVYSN